MTTRSTILGKMAISKTGSQYLAREYVQLAIILGVTLLHGLVYVFLMPPWQHYDEPANFEYAWLLGNRAGYPSPGDYDPGMRREVATSMLANGFFRDLDFTVDPEVGDQPIWIGVSQLNDPPLYYLLAALPMNLMNGQDVTAQLYAGRMASLSLFLVTVLAAWGTMREITGVQSPLRWILPLTVALVPGLVDLMTAVNNDVAAVAFFSLFLWGSVRLINRGFSWFNVVWIAAAATFCYLTKSSVYAAVFLFPLVLIFGILRGKWRWLGWVVAAGSLMIGLAAMVSWGDAAMWYRATDQAGPTRVANPKSVWGKHALAVQTKAETSPRWYEPLVQPIPPSRIDQLAGKQVTLGGWAWASDPVQSISPSLQDGEAIYSQTIDLGREPRFFVFTASLDEDVSRLWVTVGPGLDPGGANVSIYYDGLILVEGQPPLDIPPQFLDATGGSGVWAGQPVTNLLRNGSAETAGPGFRPWVEKIIVKAFPSYSTLSYVLHYLLDWQGAGWHHWMVGGRLFRTFWGHFGWGNVPLLGHKPYRLLLGFTLVGLAGASLRLWRLKKSDLWTVFIVLALAMAAIWLGAFVRGVSNFTASPLWIPVARYAYPAIIPTLLILAAGWLELLKRMGRLMHMTPRVQYCVYTALLIGLDIWSVASIIKFFY